jgi:hypothetical protein
MERSGAYVVITNGVAAAVHRDTILPGTTPNNRVLLTEFRAA